MGKFHRLIRFFKDKLYRCVWDLIVKNEQPVRRRRQLLLRVQRLLLRRGSKEVAKLINVSRCTGEAAVVAVARATCARVAGSRRFP